MLLYPFCKEVHFVVAMDDVKDRQKLSWNECYCGNRGGDGEVKCRGETEFKVQVYEKPYLFKKVHSVVAMDDAEDREEVSLE